MVKEFELEVLKFMLRDKAGVNLIDVVPETFIKDPGISLLLHVVKTYFKEYGTIPHLANLKQYINDGEGISDELQSVLMPLVDKTFTEDFDVDRTHLKDKIIKEVQIYKTKSMVAAFMDSGAPNFERMLKEMGTIVDIPNQLFDTSSARFALKDFTGFNHITYENVVRTPFETMNSMMSAGGLFAPQIFVVMAPAKGFKSGTMVNFAVHCVMQGKKVFYADFENGVDDIINRIYCKLTKANYMEMKEDITADTLREIVKFAGVMGGDIYVKDYEMYKGQPYQVRTDIEKQIAQEWKPDVIIWDYADIASPSSSEDRRKSKREQIQSIYGEIKNINKEFNVISITASQMNRESISKPVADMSALAEDFGKAANADAIWAHIQTEEEAQKGVSRMHPVVQRKGVKFTGKEFVYLQLDQERQHMEEISEDEWMTAVDVELEDDLEDI